MAYYERVSSLGQDPEELEEVYQEAVRAGDADAFQRAIDASHGSAPDNLLYAAWFYRLRHAAAQAKGYVVAWAWAFPLAVANGLLFWWLSGDRYMVTIKGYQGVYRQFLPGVVLAAAPLSALCVLGYLTVTGRKRWVQSLPIAIGLLGAGAYAVWTYPSTGPAPFQEQYLTLVTIHLPLLAWVGVGAYAIAGHHDPRSRFCFLIKSMEAIVLGGLFVAAGALFTAISMGLFQALSVDFPELVQRLFIAGGGGLIPVLSAAVIYNPKVPPSEQAFNEGLSKLLALLMRILLPLSLIVLLVYVAFIPFNFRAPFENRDVLIIYNGMLFAVVALLVGATPLSLDGVSSRLAHWLRLGIVAVAALALIVSLYALAAILYRTALDRPTPNRLAFIGWNVVNIGLLILVLLYQVRAKDAAWPQRLYRAYSAGTIAYAAWILVVLLAVPWVFGIDQGVVEALPPAVQKIVYENPGPILLKCPSSPHIYLLDRGEKRWIDSIDTFEDRGYVWRDVHSVTCGVLRSVPDGVPIPSDAGLPPQP